MIGLPPDGDFAAYLEPLMDRLVATEIEQLTKIQAIDAVPYFIHWQEAFPYITHRLGETMPIDQAADEQQRNYTIIGRFVGGHVGVGSPGQPERLMYRFEPSIVTLFTQNFYLLSGTYPTPLPELTPDPSKFRRDTGTRAFDNRGIQGMPNQIGFEFSLGVEINLTVHRKYYYQP